MSKRIKAVPNDDQPLLFQPNEDKPATDTVKTYQYLEKAARQDKLNRIRFTSKEEYYQSEEWQSKRRQKMHLVGNKCEECGKTSNLDVHHLSYVNLYDERMEDLKVLCRYHHKIADGNREYSTGLYSYIRTKYEDGCVDPSYFADEFDRWRESKEGV